MMTEVRLDHEGPWRPHYGLVWQLGMRPRALRRKVQARKKELPVPTRGEMEAVPQEEVEELAKQISDNHKMFGIRELNDLVEEHPQKASIDKLTVDYAMLLARLEATAVLAAGVEKAEIPKMTGRGGIPRFTEEPVFQKRAKSELWGDTRYLKWRAATNKLRELADGKAAEGHYQARQWLQAFGEELGRKAARDEQEEEIEQSKTWAARFACWIPLQQDIRAWEEEAELTAKKLLQKHNQVVAEKWNEWCQEQVSGSSNGGLHLPEEWRKEDAEHYGQVDRGRVQYGGSPADCRSESEDMGCAVAKRRAKLGRPKAAAGATSTFRQA